MLFGELGLWIIKRGRGGGKCYLLRGPFSAKKFEEEGHKACKVYGDPALLLPLVYTPKMQKQYNVGIIPHLHDYNKIRNEYSNERVIYLNNSIEQIIDEICSCEYIISTSLHGVIVAHAYGVPAIWIKEGYIYTDGIKFNDYFASVGIPLYDGQDFQIKDFVSKRYSEIPEKIRALMLPHTPMIDIQRRIIHAAPFEIKKSIVDKVK